MMTDAGGDEHAEQQAVEQTVEEVAAEADAELRTHTGMRERWRLAGQRRAGGGGGGGGGRALMAGRPQALIDDGVHHLVVPGLLLAVPQHPEVAEEAEELGEDAADLTAEHPAGADAAAGAHVDDAHAGGLLAPALAGGDLLAVDHPEGDGAGGAEVTMMAQPAPVGTSHRPGSSLTVQASISVGTAKNAMMAGTANTS